EPVEAADRGLQPALAGGLEDEQRLARDRNEGAVLRRDQRGVVDGDEPAGAGLVDGDKAGIARGVPAIVPREEPQIGVVAVAGRAIGRDRDGLGGVEIGGVGAVRRQKRERAGNDDDGPRASKHDVLPAVLPRDNTMTATEGWATLPLAC